MLKFKSDLIALNEYNNDTKYHACYGSLVKTNSNELKTNLSLIVEKSVKVFHERYGFDPSPELISEFKPDFQNESFGHTAVIIYHDKYDYLLIHGKYSLKLDEIPCSRGKLIKISDKTKFVGINVPVKYGQIQTNKFYRIRFSFMNMFWLGEQIIRLNDKNYVFIPNKT